MPHHLEEFSHAEQASAQRDPRRDAGLVATGHGPTRRRGGRSPAGRTEFVDDKGRLWRKVRGPLDRRLTQRLATQADALIIGEAGGERFRHVPAADRFATWNQIKDRLMTECVLSHTAYEFVSSDGLTLLYIEENC